MLDYLTLVLACQLIGEFTVNTLQLPFPGPVAGMLILFIFLTFNGGIPQQLECITTPLLNNLSLLFVPAGVGVMVHFELLGSDALPLSIALIASTVLTVAVTALVMTFLNKRLGTDANTGTGTGTGTGKPDNE
ncbi:murein hydrolase transporter LrgA [Chromatiales bacterium (ex Bugula neritina AB1)]|nr:murein hydrolase transporter LrgA [Chromatiales bacterium (ex Bugula neritina AB1)]